MLGSFDSCVVERVLTYAFTVLHGRRTGEGAADGKSLQTYHASVAPTPLDVEQAPPVSTGACSNA